MLRYGVAISVSDVEYLAHLARVELSREELERLTSELGEILNYVEKLKGAATEGIPPTSHVLELSNVFRPDQTQPSLPLEAVLKNAPDREGPFFRVPRIIET